MVFVRDHRVISRRYAYGISWIGQESGAKLSILGIANQFCVVPTVIGFHGVEFDVVIEPIRNGATAKTVISYHYSFMIICLTLESLTECGTRAVGQDSYREFTLHTAPSQMAYRLIYNCCPVLSASCQPATSHTM